MDSDPWALDFLTANGWQKEWFPEKKNDEPEERSVLVNNTKPVIMSTVSLRSSTRLQSRAQSNIDKNSTEKSSSGSKVNNVLSEYIEAFCAQHEIETNEQEDPDDPPASPPRAPTPKVTAPPPTGQKSAPRTSVIKFSASTRTGKKTKQQGALGQFEFFDERAMKCYDAYGRINMGTKEDHGPVDWDVLLDIAIEEYGGQNNKMEK